jgi:hypothetical protein
MVGAAGRSLRDAVDRLDPRQRTALTAWVAFTGTFCAVRAITYSIRDGGRLLRNVDIGGVHIHHYVWGIAMLAAAGGSALRGADARHAHPGLAAMYGAGGALVVDEFALLLDLEDVYWTRQGRVSVDAGIAVIGTVGSYFVGMPFWHRLASAARPSGIGW